MSPDVDLVVQGPSLTESDLPLLTELARPSALELLMAAVLPAYRLLTPRVQEGVVAGCNARGFDAAFVPRDRRLDRVALVAIDMDSTLIENECIDELAELKGMGRDVARITERAMRGEIDFGESLLARVALLQGLPVEALDRIYDQRVRLSPGAARMLSGFAAAGAKTLLVSGGFTFFTQRLKERLAIDECVANELEVHDGRLTGRIAGDVIDAAAKGAELRKRTARIGRSAAITVAIGDGANDLAMFRAADVAIAYRGKPVVRAEATHTVDHCGLDAVLNLFT